MILQGLIGGPQNQKYVLWIQWSWRSQVTEPRHCLYGYSLSIEFAYLKCCMDGIMWYVGYSFFDNARLI